VDGGWYLLLPRGAGRPGQIVRAQTRGGQTTYHRLASVIRVEPQGGPEIWAHVASSAAAAREEQRAAPAPAAPVARTVTSYSAPIEIEQIRPAAAAAAPVTADLPTPGALTGGNLIAGARCRGSRRAGVVVG
jgi:hypothetical protein